MDTGLDGNLQVGEDKNLVVEGRHQPEEACQDYMMGVPWVLVVGKAGLEVDGGQQDKMSELLSMTSHVFEEQHGYDHISETHKYYIRRCTKQILSHFSPQHEPQTGCDLLALYWLEAWSGQSAKHQHAD